MHATVERLYEAMRALGLEAGQTSAARFLSLPNSQTVKNWEERGMSNAGMVAASMKGINPAWLQTGVGNALINRGASSWRPILAWEVPEDLPEGEFILIPRMDIKLSAGSGAEQDIDVAFSRERALAFRAEWIRSHHLKPGKLVSLIAHGDSMEPRIQDGDALVVDTSQTEVVDGRVYALYYDGGERVKRLTLLPGKGLRISSDNSAYKDIDLTGNNAESVRIIGRVVHVSGEGGL